MVDLSKVLPLVRAGKGPTEIKEELGITYHAARKAVTAAKAILDSPTTPKVDPDEPGFRLQLLRSIRQRASRDELAEQLKVSRLDLDRAVQSLKDHGYLVDERGSTIRLASSTERAVETINLDNHFEGPARTLGVVSDTHLCSRAERLDVLNAAYDTFKERGITTVLHAGNLVDGESKVNRHDIVAHGIADQVTYAIENYPKREGIQTLFIDGDDHEGWWQQREGIEFGRLLQHEAEAAGRTDLRYLGYVEADIAIPSTDGNTIIKVMHPGGGSAYALSYTSQKLVESLTGGDKPGILIIGHYHKAEYCFVRNIHALQAGTTCDQTTFMRKKKLAAHVGFWIITFEADKYGAVTRFAPEWFPFFDRGYYRKRDLITLK